RALPATLALRVPGSPQATHLRLPVVANVPEVDKSLVKPQMPFKGEGAYPSVDYPDCLLRLARSHRLRFAEEYSAKAVGIQQVRIQRGGNVQQRRKVSVEHGPALRLLPP